MSDLPPWSLSAVLPRVFVSGNRNVRSCAVSPPGFLYFCANDGSLMVLDGSVTPPVEHEDIPAPGISPSKRQAERIAVLPSVQRLVVLAQGGALSFHSLPGLEAVSAGAAAGVVGKDVVKGVLAFAIDENTMNRRSVHVAVIRRKGLAIFRITSSSVDLLKEMYLPAPNTVITAVALQGFSLCYADTNSYTLLNVASAASQQLLPISQDPRADQEQPNLDHRPITAAVGNSEFLFVSHTSTRSLGLFVSAETGDPCRGTLEWNSNVRHFVVHGGHVYALLLDRTIQIHQLDTLELIHALQIPEDIPDTRMLITSVVQPIEISGIASSSAKELLPVKADLFPHIPSSRPATPERVQRHTAYLEESDQLTSVSVALQSKNGLSALRRPSALDHAMQHFHLNRYEQALACFTQADRRGYGFINFKIGMHHIRDTEFESASVYMAVACDEGLDPRFLIQAYPDLIDGAVRQAGRQQGQVWQGAQDDIHELAQGVDKIILSSLYKNYSPQINPKEESRSLHAQLMMQSRAMIRLVLSSYREARAHSSSVEVRAAVLTALARLAAEEDAMEECLGLAASELVDADDLIRWLQMNQYVDLLSKLYQQLGRTRDSLQLWVDSYNTGMPLASIGTIVATIQQLEDPLDRRKYGLWLLEREEEQGFSVLLSDISAQDFEATQKVYEEILSHTSDAVADRYLFRCAYLFQSEKPMKDLLEKRLLVQLATFKDLAIPTLESKSIPDALMQVNSRESKTRLFFILFLAAFPGLSLAQLRTELERWPSLAFERSIIYSRLGLWRQALSTLVLSAGDIISAEVLCRQCTVPLSVNTLSRLFKHLQLRGEEPPLPSIPQSASTSDLMQMLIDILLTTEASGTNKNATLIRFITSQASYLDAQDTLSRLPNEITIQDLESFLTRALRRTLHFRYEGAIEKPLSSAQALDVSLELLDLRANRPNAPVEVTQDMLQDGVVDKINAVKAVLDDKATAEHL